MYKKLKDAKTVHGCGIDLNVQKLLKHDLSDLSSHPKGFNF